MTIQEHFDANKIKYHELESDLFDVPDFGKILYVDFSKKKSIYRNFVDGDESYIHLNIFETKEELLDSGIQYVGFMFGDSYNYVDLKDDDLDIKPLLNLGSVSHINLDFDYVNLGVHTSAEILGGIGEPKEWVARAKFLGHKALGISDFNTMGYTLSMQKACDEAGIKPVIGYSTKLTDGWIRVSDRADITNNIKTANIKLYAKDKDGLSSLLRIQKTVMVDYNTNEPEDGYPKGYLTVDELIKFSKGLILVMGVTSAEWLLFNRKAMETLKDRFSGDLYYQIDLNEYMANRIDTVVLNSAKTYFSSDILKDIPPVLIPDCYYPERNQDSCKITVNKIGLNARARSKTRVIYSEDAGYHSNQQWYKDIDEHYETFKDIFETINPYDVLKTCADNSIKIANSCNVRYTLDKNYMPEYELTEQEVEKWGDSMSMFDGLLEEGFLKKVPKGKEELYRERLDMEKYVIKSTNNVDYMLNQYDVVKWSEENDIIVGAGRGSAGGSLVLYLLNVTKVDPIRFNLLFERFLLPERAGLYDASVTKIVEEVSDSEDVIEIEFEDGRKIILDADSQILTDGSDDVLYADELKEGVGILFDNIDNVFKIK